MIYRDATATDLPAIVAIYNATIPGRMVTADTEPVSVESRGRWFSEHTPGRSPLWVVESPGGGIDAWLSFQAFYGRPAYQATSEVSIYVAESARRQGLGQALLAQAVRRGPGLGLETLLGFIFAHNAPSLALFERNAFARWAHLPRVARLDGVERDLIIVGRRIAG